MQRLRMLSSGLCCSELGASPPDLLPRCSLSRGEKPPTQSDCWPSSPRTERKPRSCPRPHGMGPHRTGRPLVYTALCLGGKDTNRGEAHRAPFPPAFLSGKRQEGRNRASVFVLRLPSLEGYLTEIEQLLKKGKEKGSIKSSLMRGQGLAAFSAHCRPARRPRRKALPAGLVPSSISHSHC